jgi:hypothetical protein
MEEELWDSSMCYEFIISDIPSAEEIGNTWLVASY